MAASHNALAICLTETWLTPQVEDAEVAIPGYNLFRSDRQGRLRGGTCIYVREDLAVVTALQFSNGVVDALVLKLRDVQTILFSIYRPPDTTVEELKPALEAVEETINFTQANSAK